MNNFRRNLVSFEWLVELWSRSNFLGQRHIRWVLAWLRPPFFLIFLSFFGVVWEYSRSFDNSKNWSVGEIATLKWAWSAGFNARSWFKPQFEKFNKYDQLNLSTRAGYICTGGAGTWSPQIPGLRSSLWPGRFLHHSQRFGGARRVTRRALI